MTFIFPTVFKQHSGLIKAPLTALLMAALVAGCSDQVQRAEFHDPYEVQNRAAFEGSAKLDKALLRPAAIAYGSVVPSPVRAGINNVSANLDLPLDVVNGFLQGRGETVVVNSLRFVINSTLGVGGIFDPAQSMGLTHKKTDFGETLYVWGASEGAYLVAPFVGPTTERDLAGKIVDTLINPTRVLIASEHKSAASAVDVAETLGDRYEYLEVVDSLLYESADPYAQSRLFYLQNRRHELGDTTQTEYYDPYEDPYAE